MLQSAPEGVELSKVLTLSISSKGSSGPRIHPTFANVPSKNWKTGFLPHDSKNRRSFFPNKGTAGAHITKFFTGAYFPYRWDTNMKKNCTHGKL